MTCEDDEPGEWFDSDDEAPGLAETPGWLAWALAGLVLLVVSGGATCSVRIDSRPAVAPVGSGGR